MSQHGKVTDRGAFKGHISSKSIEGGVTHTHIHTQTQTHIHTHAHTQQKGRIRISNCAVVKRDLTVLEPTVPLLLPAPDLKPNSQEDHRGQTGTGENKTRWLRRCTTLTVSSSSCIEQPTGSMSLREEEGELAQWWQDTPSCL